MAIKLILKTIICVRCDHRFDEVPHKSRNFICPNCQKVTPNTYFKGYVPEPIETTGETDKDPQTGMLVGSSSHVGVVMGPVGTVGSSSPWTSSIAFSKIRDIYCKKKKKNKTNIFYFQLDPFNDKVPMIMEKEEKPKPITVKIAGREYESKPTAYEKQTNSAAEDK